MLKYTPEELWSLRRYDVTPARAVRKVIFRYRLWRPLRQRMRVQREGIPSREGFPGATITQLSCTSISCSHWPAGNRATLSPIVCGCLNVRSLLNKFEDITELCRDRRIDILCLTESWHDADSAVLGRLRSVGYNVADRPRLRAADAADMSVNHGGVVVISAPDIVLSPITIDTAQPTTFEFICVRAVSGRFSAIFVVLYRPGSTAVQQLFFDELSLVLDLVLDHFSCLDHVAAYQDAVYIVGDLNLPGGNPESVSG